MRILRAKKNNKKGKKMTGLNNLGESRSLQLLTRYRTKRQKPNFVRILMLNSLLVLMGFPLYGPCVRSGTGKLSSCACAAPERNPDVLFAK